MKPNHVDTSEDKIYVARAAGLGLITFPKEICPDMRKGDKFELILDGRSIILIPAMNRPRAYKRVFRHAAKVFGNETSATLWLYTPQFGLGGEIPVDAIRTKKGVGEVEAVLVQIEYGMPL